MKEKFKSYLDSFNRITIIYPKKEVVDPKEKKFYLLIEDEMLAIEVTGIFELEKDYKFSCLLPESIALNVEYSVTDEKGNSSVLNSGSIVRTDLFEMLYYYSQNDLGFTYTKESTLFKVWSPVAKEMEIELIDLNGKSQILAMNPGSRGVWSIEVMGDLECYKYRFHVRIANKFETTLDPYAISSDANAKYNYVIDLNKTYQFKYPKPDFSGRMVDAVVYELHVRDFTIYFKEKNKYSGKYLGMFEDTFTEKGIFNAIEYIKNLGVTHVQLQPIYDFGGVDELNPDKWYNWGYNPVQYNVPEGWFSTNPNDPYTRINELKMLIDQFHKNGIRVVMDVVYNHVYDHETFPFHILVPGYFFRHENGQLTNVSGCKNDVASERKMASKFITDSVRYWAKEFGIDGFRFDLMGLLDIDTMNNVQMTCKSIDDKSIIYGEGWNMLSNIPDNMRANMNNYYQMPSIGFFNDRFRNIIKGNQWDKSLGFAAGGNTNIMDILYLITGSCVDNYLFLSPNQSINYVECHDNYTFYDAIKVTNPKIDEDKLREACRLALGIVLISQGVPFIHAGEEFYRTKNGDENSYQSPDSVNMVRWDQMEKNHDFVQMTKDLIEIRKTHNAFRYDRKSLIKDRIKLNDTGYQHHLRVSIRSINEDIILILKNNDTYDYVDFQGTTTMIFDGKKKCAKTMHSFELRHSGIYIFTKGR